ncbi:MAG: hypothetical protein R8G66_17960 [Cytophagales bacterium]|nr:hypothetical protein [Cytophagales bacterium]
MKQHFFLCMLTIYLCQCCSPTNDQRSFLTEKIPADNPLTFKADLIPDGKLIHKGSFSPDLTEYYYTVSDKSYKRFDTYVIRKQEERWSDPKTAFFNSDYSEHGLSFSPDGNTIYFSSTRPVESYIPDTWHLWKSVNKGGQWSKPAYIDIPNLRDKLISHPTISNQGTLYFHASNLDYSEMDLYQCKLVDGNFGTAQKVVLDIEAPYGKCTPYIAADESFLLFATVGDQLDLQISYNDGQGNWSIPKKLNEEINHSGQGNPYVTPDHQFLFFTTGTNSEKWQVKWVNFLDETTPK